MHKHGLNVPGKFGDVITTDHEVLSEDSESRKQHRHAFVVQDFSSLSIQSYPVKNKSGDTKNELQRLEPPSVKPG